MLRLLASALVLCLTLAFTSRANPPAKRVLLYEGKATEVSISPIASDDVWVTLADFKRATGFVIKPQGVCRDELCYPLPASRKKDFLVKRGKLTYFNMSEFAKLIGQAVAYDQQHSIWNFGLRPDTLNAHLETLEAPNFTLPDMHGRQHSLADFRGKKVLLVTWASW